MDTSKQIANLSLDFPQSPTTSQVLEFLIRAREIGELHGYERGYSAGQEHALRTVGLVDGKVTFDCNQDRQAHLEEFLGQQWRDQS